METDPFRIRDHVADFDAIVGEIVAASARTRETLPMILDVAYGDGPDETVDMFFPAGPRQNLPVHLFVHGGYWRMFSKRDYSCIANTITLAGAIAVIVDYSLMPGQRMEVLVDQVVRAKEWVVQHIASYGGDPLRLSVSGHSAGAHLATFTFEESEKASRVQGAFLLGGLYDLAPLQQSFLQREIALTEDEVSRFTPLFRRHRADCRVLVAVGQDETRPFHDQSDAFINHVAAQGLSATRNKITGRNHMNSVRDLGVAGSETGDLLISFINSGA
ncbi:MULTISPECIES: alpha/beta hydrolase [unclassified Rhizobium]|uniref:alpha/beta hydrolase n=1 Tax=unclassified Rhizobium TaxID=2613769 RepID=UPI00160F402E|nr:MULTISPECIES: alpha/beta hydrolase [unclassified Rhizobium]MBB3543396.1 arylformamidase [Rhizobium sp. BK399]MCS3743548.1 arylformamidase [Rhizobium sp. BK661]